MLIVVSHRTKTVEAFLGEYDPNALIENDMLVGTDMQGFRVEEPNANERFDFVDGLMVELPTDDAGNLESYRKSYWRWIDGQLVKNPAYVDADEEAARRAQEREIENKRKQLWEVMRNEMIDELLGIENDGAEKDKIISDIQDLENDFAQRAAAKQQRDVNASSKYGG